MLAQYRASIVCSENVIRESDSFYAQAKIAATLETSKPPTAIAAATIPPEKENNAAKESPVPANANAHFQLIPPSISPISSTVISLIAISPL